ncbi:universal stress protein [Oscillatoria sp. FACHB-1407]|uniref:universal stress protein n=1 Tax=Oscillatoria sp. FACHB-1407 TaxID=2692847 RepID=UPI00168428CB|nr:universal stress protein [Oscillatoria sp. FACHB-1407]MBD2461466.1 universal stress protein [Oscillatoria sp. FACHB-1407]
MFQKILVALDNSNMGNRVFDEAVTLAKATNASLMLLHVLTPFEDNYPTMPVAPGLDSYYPAMYGEAIEEYAKRWHQYEEHALDFLRNRAASALNEGVTAEFSQNVGDPGRAICSLAGTWSADLIVMGRRGRSGLSEFVLGSVSNYVLHHAPCSVFVVQGQADARPADTTEQEAIATPV